MFGWSLSEPEFSKTEYDQVFCLFLACNMNGLIEERTLLKIYPTKVQKKKKSGSALFTVSFCRYLMYLYIHVFVDIYLYIYISPFIGKMCVPIIHHMYVYICISSTYHHHYGITSRELTYPPKKKALLNIIFLLPRWDMDRSVPWKVSPIYIG